MKIFLSAILILCGAMTLSAQAKKFRWTTELCEFEGTYAAKKYTEAQLRDTLKLFAIGGFGIVFNATPENYADIKNSILTRSTKNIIRNRTRSKNSIL